MIFFISPPFSHTHPSLVDQYPVSACIEVLRENCPSWNIYLNFNHVPERRLTKVFAITLPNTVILFFANKKKRNVCPALKILFLSPYFSTRHLPILYPFFSFLFYSVLFLLIGQKEKNKGVSYKPPNNTVV